MISKEKVTVDSNPIPSKLEDERIETKDIGPDNGSSGGDLSELIVVAEGEDRATVFIFILVFCCGISGLLFGQSIQI